MFCLGPLWRDCLPHERLASLQEKRSVLVTLWILVFLVGNTLYVLYTFSSQRLYYRCVGTGMVGVLG